MASIDDAAILSAGLRRDLMLVSRSPRLLVASAYDGTLAPLVTGSVPAQPLTESVVALRSLATLSGTNTAVISGRSLPDLAVLSRLPAEVSPVGSHGSEFETGVLQSMDGLDPDKGPRWTSCAIGQVLRQRSISATTAATSPRSTGWPAPTSASRLVRGRPGAKHRVDGPEHAAAVLAYLFELRRAWLHGDHAVPIERISMLANGRAVALVAPDARITWMCHPEPDSAALPRRAADAAVAWLAPGGDFSTNSVAALVDMRIKDASALIDRLVDEHLATVVSRDRYGLHDLVAEYARNAHIHEDPEPEQQAAAERLLGYYLHASARAANLLVPHRATVELSGPVPGARTAQLISSHIHRYTQHEVLNVTPQQR